MARKFPRGTEDRRAGVVEQVTTGAEAVAQTRRERQRQATMTEIVAAARALLSEPGGLSLRAVAQRMGITAPALYRYVASYQDLVYLVADDIDRELAEELSAARDGYPEEDPAARILAAAVAFRRWALTSRDEFSLVFANPITGKSLEVRDEISGSAMGELFNEMLLRVWEKYRFPIPTTDQLDPDVVKALQEPFSAAIPCAYPGELLGLGWVFMSAWARLYGTVTLEVFGHLDPQIIESGAMFRSMLEEQAGPLGISDEMPRLRQVIAAEMSR